MSRPTEVGSTGSKGNAGSAAPFTIRPPHTPPISSDFQIAIAERAGPSLGFWSHLQVLQLRKPGKWPKSKGAESNRCHRPSAGQPPPAASLTSISKTRKILRKKQRPFSVLDNCE